MRGDLNTAQFLLEQGAKTETRDRQGRTALHWATRINNEPLMALLLEKGANLEAGNNHGDTPLHRAADEGNTATLQWLLEHGADPNAQNNQNQNPSDAGSHIKIQHMSKSNMKQITTLLQLGAQLDIKDTEGRNGLSYIFDELSAEAAEQILHEYSHLITRELLNDQDNRGYYPKDWISSSDSSFRMFVTGLTFPETHAAEIRSASTNNDQRRLNLLRQPRFQ